MPIALLCSEGPLAELRETVLGRQDVDRRFARTLEDVKRIARDTRPDIAVVDGALDNVREVIRGLRKYPRQVSIVAIARKPTRAHEIELMEAGANAVLVPPPDAEWDETLSRLSAVPPRKHARVPVYFETELHVPDRTKVGLG